MDAVAALRDLWTGSAARLTARLEGLGEDEFFWEPAQPAWSVRRDPAAPSGWQIDYPFPPPVPPPVTTIAWRLVHLANGNWIRWEHAFGPGRRMFPDLPVPGTAAGAVAYWADSRAPIEEWMRTAAPFDLDELRPNPIGDPLPAGRTLSILLEEQVHHGAEIALLRDLYTHTH
jgi:hypothetical protein